MTEAWIYAIDADGNTVDSGYSQVVHGWHITGIGDMVDWRNIWHRAYPECDIVIEEEAR